MRNYTEQQLQENYEKFLNFIRKAFVKQPERMEKLLHMYSAEELGMELLVAPASGRAHFHSAYIGGYMDDQGKVDYRSLVDELRYFNYDDATKLLTCQGY